MSYRPHICIISLSQIAKDARVLRQIDYLAPHYDITIIGFGDAPPQWAGQVGWYDILGSSREKWVDLQYFRLSAWGGRFLPPLYAFYSRWAFYARRARQAALACRADVYHANDWNTLPLVVPIAEKLGAKVLFDAHEYAPLQFDTARGTFIHGAHARHFLRRYAHRAHRMITVCPMLAEKYAEVFGLQAEVIMNAPQPTDLAPSPIDPEAIHLVHHGGAQRRRHPELMIETMRYADARFHLHFYLVGVNIAPYVQELQAFARSIAPDRIHFHEAIPPADITRTINQHDIGFYILKPYPFNHRAALPNKFFEFINASLAVCISPTEGMARLARDYDFSLITETFEPEEIAQKLNTLTPERIMAMKQNARQAARVLNADVEMGKLVGIYEALLSG